MSNKYEQRGDILQKRHEQADDFFNDLGELCKKHNVSLSPGFHRIILKSQGVTVAECNYVSSDGTCEFDIFSRNLEPKAIRVEPMSFDDAPCDFGHDVDSGVEYAEHGSANYKTPVDKDGHTIWGSGVSHTPRIYPDFQCVQGASVPSNRYYEENKMPRFFNKLPGLVTMSNESQDKDAKEVAKFNSTHQDPIDESSISPHTREPEEKKEPHFGDWRDKFLS